MCFALVWPLTGKGVRNADLSTCLRGFASVGLAYCHWVLCRRFSLVGGGRAMTRLQILYLRRLHGLTEAQAQAIAALVWGAGQ